MLTMAACARKPDANNLAVSEFGQLKDAGIALSIIENVVKTDTDSIMVEYINGTDTDYAFGEEPHLEIEIDGKWYVVQVKADTMWEEINHIMLPNESINKEFSLKLFYENLNPGHYRIVKTFFADSGNVTAAVEFDMQ